MTDAEVRQFLICNNWVQALTTNTWTHPNMPMSCFIDETFLTGFPNMAFGIAISDMNRHLIAIKHTNASFAQSQAHKAPQQAAPTPLPMGITPAQQAASALGHMQNVTFNYNGGITKRSGYTLTTDSEGIQTRTYHEKKCDCGAVKCKTTHSHWCSTQMKGNQNGK